MKATRTCSVDGCCKRLDSHGYCGMHARRWRLTGDPGPVESTRGGVCGVADCPEPHYSKRYCVMHYNRWRRHGDPLRVDRGGARERDEVGYWGVHSRLRRQCGPASAHVCRECGEQASEWSYTYGDPEQRLDDRGYAYSLDLTFYVPRCVACHRTHDLAKRGDR